MRILQRIARAGARTGLPWLAVAALMVPASAAATSVNQAFQPSTIGIGSASRLIYTVTADTAPITAAGFSNTLPPNVTVALARPEDNLCGGRLDAPLGGGTVSWSEGRLAQSESCQITVYVTSTTVATHTNPAFDLTASDGVTAFPSANLTISVTTPGFTRTVSPASAEVGERVTMTYLFDNSASASQLAITFTETLPAGATIASPANLTNLCLAGSGTLVANPGDNRISVSSLVALSGTSCTLAVDIVTSGLKDFDFVTSQLPSGGFATGRLTVSSSPVLLSIALPEGTASPGQTVPMRFRVVSPSRDASATAMAFSVDLEAALPGLVATGLPKAGICGSGSSASGTSLLSISGANLSPASPACEFEIDVLVPPGAATGQSAVTSSTLSGTLGGTPFTAPAASAALEVAPLPTLTQSFSTNVIGSGQTITITYTLTNTSASQSLSAFTLSDTFGSQQIAVVSLPAAGSCGPGSSFVTNAAFPQGDPLTLSGSGLSLPAGDSCTFDLTLTFNDKMRTGQFETIVKTAQGTVGGAEVDARITTATARIVAPPTLTLTLGDPIVLAGEATTLDLSLSNDSHGQLDADEYPDYTNITFSVDLDGALTGLSATGTPLSGACGPGSTLSGSSTLSLAGGSLGAGQSCSFSVGLAAPAGAASGIYFLQSTQPQAQAFGTTAIGPVASALLQLGGLSGSMAFGTTPVAPGSSVTLTYSLTNESLTETASFVSMQHNLQPMGTGYTFATALPPTPCGAGSSISLSNSNTTLTLSTGSLAAGASCSFAVTVNVPAGSALGDQLTNTTSIFADFGAGLRSLPAFGTALRVEDPAQPRDLTPANLNEPDPDGDGVTTADEQAAGDANGDGIADAIQPTVASRINPVTGRAVALSVDPGCGAISSFSLAAANTLPVRDGEALYPEGIASFTLPCTTATVTLTYPGAIIRPGMVLRKYGPQAPAFGGPDAWYTLPGATIDRAARTVTYTLTDGALGDSTGVDGQIVDPVGLGLFPATGIPASGQTTMLMMVLGIILLGAQRLRHRRR